MAPFRVVAAAIARLLAGIAAWASLLLAATSFRDPGPGRTLILLAFAGLGAGIHACTRTLVRGASERRDSGRSPHPGSLEFFRPSSGLLSGPRRTIDP